MRIAFFAHSWRSDWNHGNAHFLRGLVTALTHRGHVVRTFEPHDAWSARELAADRGAASLEAWRAAYPSLRPELYEEAALDLDAALDGAELVVVHEWTAPALIERIGRHRRGGGRYTLLFHDTHHRSVSSPADIAGLMLEDYDGVLAFGETVRERYVRAGWSRLVWTWHEAADVRVFRPQPAPAQRDDIVFIGNWGDDERTRELHDVPPRAGALARADRPRARRPLPAGRHRLGRGRRPRLRRLRAEPPRAGDLRPAPRHRARAAGAVRAGAAGVPTIRMFEALACGIPLVSAPWSDCEGLFRAGRRLPHGDAIRRPWPGSSTRVLHERGLAQSLAAAGLQTIASRHTCGHRVDELMRIVESLRGRAAREVVAG